MPTTKPDILHEPHNAEKREELQQLAIEALATYGAVDPNVPLGGLSPREYERWRVACEQAELDPHQQYEFAWLLLERAMAIGRADINTSTEEPYTQKDMNIAFDEAQQAFNRLGRYETAPAFLRTQARVAGASVLSHREIITGKPHITSARPYSRYLETIRTAATDLLKNDSHTQQEIDFLHALEVQAIGTECVFQAGWFLPAPPRQPWIVTAHNTERSLADVTITFREGGSEQVAVINPAALAVPVVGDDEFRVLRTYLEIPVSFIVRAKGIPMLKSGSPAAIKWKEDTGKAKQLERVADRLVDSVRAHLEWQVEQGFKPAEVMVVETAKEEITERDICDEAIWYLTEYDGTTLDDQFETSLRLLDDLRVKEGLLPEERRVLAWMHFDYARMLALNAGTDKSQLNAAREYFTVAMQSFEATAKMFDRLRRPGDQVAALAMLEALHMYRAHLTSTDKYAIKRAEKTYAEGIASLFAEIAVQAGRVQGDHEQFEVLNRELQRATLILLVATTSNEWRSLVMTPPVRTGEFAVAYAPTEYNETALMYDQTSSVVIEVIEGAEIIRLPGRVQIGRDRLQPDGALALLTELTDYFNPPKKATGKQKAGKKKAKGPASRQPQDQPRELSPATQELAVEIAIAIGEAAEDSEDA